MPVNPELLRDNFLASVPNYKGNSIRVCNISKNARMAEVLASFNALVGPIRNFKSLKDASGTHLEITFNTRDEARALCMTGYKVGGTPLLVTLANNAPFIAPELHPSVDDRRNLYVLGLPFALTKNEFAAIFSRYGTVSHCVILATVDNSSRRRGFVVMSTHEEAKRAMSELTRTQIKGHTIDVSWAVVQRSRGFLDGSDRAMLLDSRNAQVPRNDDNGCSASESPINLQDDIDPCLGSYVQTAEPTSTLLVTKLPALLFSQKRDLEPLFCPFGEIKKLQVVETTTTGTLSVLVQYSSLSAGREAKQALQGQSYINYRLDVQFLGLMPDLAGQEEPSPLISSMEKCNPIDFWQCSNFSAEGFRTQLKSYNILKTFSNASVPTRRPTPFRATSLSPINHERNPHLISSQWESGQIQLSSDQFSHIKPLFNNRQNLLA